MFQQVKCINYFCIVPKQIEWAEREGYHCTNALFEVYVTDPSQVADVNDNITEVYYPVKKIISKY